MQFRKVAILGVGLLGGSLGLALQSRRLASSITGLVRRQSATEACRQKGVAHEITLDLATAVNGADLIVFCTPLGQISQLGNALANCVPPGTLVTDVGSVKGSVVAELEPALATAGAHYIGSHPMAGGETTGVGEAHANLFSGAVCVITPTPHSNHAALDRVEKLWRDLGARPVRMSPQVHDQLVSRGSHLPHVAAAQLAHYVLNPEHPAAQTLLCASGFRDATRIASGSPEIWRDIALANREHLGQALEAFMKDLSGFQASLKAGDAEAIERFFREAKQRRDHWQTQGKTDTREE